MHLHQDSQSLIARGAGQHPQAIGRERSYDQEHGACPRGARFIQLQLVEDEILAQHRHWHGARHLGKVVERAAEVQLVGQDRDGHGPAPDIRPRMRHRIEIFANRARRRRATLDLGDDPDLPTCQGRRERARIGRRASPALELPRPRPQARDPVTGSRENRVKLGLRHACVRSIFG